MQSRHVVNLLRLPEQTEEVVFAIRQPKGHHWYENMGYAITDVNDKVYGSRGYLCKLNLRTGKVTLLLGMRGALCVILRFIMTSKRYSSPTAGAEWTTFISMESMPTTQG